MRHTELHTYLGARGWFLCEPLPKTPPAPDGTQYNAQQPYSTASIQNSTSSIHTFRRKEPCTSRTATGTLPNPAPQTKPLKEAPRDRISIHWRVAPKKPKTHCTFMPAWAHRLLTFSFAISAAKFLSSPIQTNPRSFRIFAQSLPLQRRKINIATFPKSPVQLIASRKTKEQTLLPTMLDKLVGFAMLVAASVIFLYYTIWTLLMVKPPPSYALKEGTQNRTDNTRAQPFVDGDHPLQNLFLPRVWAIRIPVILLLLGSAVVGSFVGMVMIRSNQKKAAKAKAAAKKKA
ncbi:uncharacterized protein Triagg1_9832 [Trichoderma aggressivum f. europaeum]|uniref:Dolichol phosphate-mannose biosynthesis regulatory protein n=1 Tax=Trichoderma aggressivum f. europaeum TaxID=173218 RepID=A0AAE1LYM8_9HYPO|nr:hypothetical protein Triagg1_9832 [Trichoderma aggressivum f. europaeum]